MQKGEPSGYPRRNQFCCAVVHDVGRFGLDSGRRRPSNMRTALDRSEQQDAQARVAVRAPVVHEAIRLQGEEELARPAMSLAWSALAAGLSMAFSLITEGILATHLPDARWLLTCYRLLIGPRRVTNPPPVCN